MSSSTQAGDYSSPAAFSVGLCRCLRYTLARRVCRANPLSRRVDGVCGRGPRLAMGEESAPRRGAKRIMVRRACVRRAGVPWARHAERSTEGTKPEGGLRVQPALHPRRESRRLRSE